MKSKIILTLILCFSSLAFGQAHDHLTKYFLSTKFQKSARKLLKQATAQKNNDQKGQNDLIIGDIDPIEIVTITGDYYLNGNITIVNHGIFYIDSANFKIDGDIFIMGHGQLNVTGGTFTVIREFIFIN